MNELNIPNTFNVQLTEDDVKKALTLYMARQFPEHHVRYITFTLEKLPVVQISKKQRAESSSVGQQMADVESGKVTQR